MVRYYQLVDFLTAFGYDDYSADGVADFFDIVVKIAEFREENPQAKSGSGAIFRDEAKKRGRYYLEWDQYIKRRIVNIISADEEALALWGVYPAKRTVQLVAWACADMLLK